MQSWERDILRELAKEKQEISNLPIMKVRKELWTKHNDLKSDITPIHFEAASVNHAEFNHTCKCISPTAIAIEKQLANSLINHKMIGDDRVVTDDFVCLFKSSFTPLGLPVIKTKTEGIGFHIEPQLTDLEDPSKIRNSSLMFDYQASIEWKEFVQEQIGDILNVRMGMNCFHACLTNDIVHLMGMDNMFMAMYDNPDEFHFMMNTLSDDYVNYFKQLEKLGMICANNGNDFLGQGTFGFSQDLPNKAHTTEDCWGFMDSQETIGISASMFDEFFFPYYKKIADIFGLLSYGCCEPVHGFWEKSLSKFSNLRKISISPWCDEEYMAEKLASKKVIYQRKPSPNFIGVGDNLDEQAFREHIRKTIKLSKNCKLEITFRDVYSLNGNLSKPRRAVEITREELANR